MTNILDEIFGPETPGDTEAEYSPVEFLRAIFQNADDGHGISIAPFSGPQCRNITIGELRRDDTILDPTAGQPEIGYSLNLLSTGWTGRAKNDGVVGASCIGMDVDLRCEGKASGAEYPTRREVDAAVEDLPPSFVVDSGRGLHLFWLLDELLPAEQSERLYKDVRQALQERTGGKVDGAVSQAKVLRLPGSLNSKAGKVCKVIEHNGTVYSASELEKWTFSGRLDLSTGGTENNDLQSFGGVTPDLNPQLLRDAAFIADLSTYEPWEEALRAIHYEHQGDQAGLELCLEASAEQPGGRDDDKGRDVEAQIRQKYTGYSLNNRTSTTGRTLLARCKSDLLSGSCNLPDSDETKPMVQRLVRHFCFTPAELEAVKGFVEPVLGSLGIGAGGVFSDHGEMMEFFGAGHLVLEEGQVFYFTRIGDRLVKMKKEQAAEYFASYWVDTGGRQGIKPAFPMFFSAPDRPAVLDGADYFPEQEGRDIVGDKLNLWQPSNVAAIENEEQASRVNELLMELCNGDAKLYRYARGWIRFTLDNPGERAQVMLTFIGAPGTGKSTICDFITALHGKRGMVVDGFEQLMQFNAVLEGTSLVHFDDLFLSGKAQVDKWKSLVTSNELLVNQKKIAMVRRRNITNFCGTLNKRTIEKSLPVMGGERRLVLIETGEGLKRDSKYFVELKEMVYKRGGLEAWKYDILNDASLDDFHPAHTPEMIVTQAQVEQRIENLDSMESWMFEALNDGNIWGGGEPMPHLSTGEGLYWPDAVEKELLYKLYLRHAQGRGRRAIASKTVFSRRLKNEFGFNTRSKYAGVRADRKRAYGLPQLLGARQRFAEDMFSTSFDWEEPMD